MIKNLIILNIILNEIKYSLKGLRRGSIIELNLNREYQGNVIQKNN